MKHSQDFFRVPFSLLTKTTSAPYRFPLYQKEASGQFRCLSQEWVDSKDFNLSPFKSARAPLFVSREDKNSLIDFLGHQSGGRGDGFTKDQLQDSKHILLPLTQIVCAEIQTLLSQPLRDFFINARPVLEQTVLDIASTPKGLSLMLRLFYSHDYLLRHSFLVSALSFQLSQEVHSQAGQRRAVVQGALLHDIGMLRIDEEVYVKASLSESDWDVMRAHPVVGEKMLAELEVFDHAVIEIIAGHHSQPNGRGYGKAGGELSHLVGVVDAFATMILPTPYRSLPRTPSEALAALREDEGHFERTYVQLINDHLLCPHLKKAS